MCNHDNRLFLFSPDIQDLILHIHSGKCVQRAKRLVQKQNIRMIDQRSYQRHSLRHTSGELMRIVFSEIFKSYHFQHMLYQFFILLFLHTQAEGYILLYRKPRKQCCFLEYHSTIRSGSNNRFPAKSDLTGSRSDQSCDQSQNR